MARAEGFSKFALGHERRTNMLREPDARPEKGREEEPAEKHGGNHVMRMSW